MFLVLFHLSFLHFHFSFRHFLVNVKIDYDCEKIFYQFLLIFCVGVDYEMLNVFDLERRSKNWKRNLFLFFCVFFSSLLILFESLLNFYEFFPFTFFCFSFFRLCSLLFSLRILSNLHVFLLLGLSPSAFFSLFHFETFFESFFFFLPCGFNSVRLECPPSVLSILLEDPFLCETESHEWSFL